MIFCSALVAFAVVGCGGDDGGEPATGANSGGSGSGSGGSGSGSGSGGSGSGSGGSSANAAPSIGGAPSPQIVAGGAYSFTPTANDSDGDGLTFSVSNLPAWASFDPTNGRLSGTPGDGDVGNYTNVAISVSDGTASTSLAAFSIEVVALGLGSATLSWVPPTENMDGTPLNNDLAGYKIYWGTSQNDYSESVTIETPGVTQYMIEGLTPDTWYFVATAVNRDGVESQFSNVASKTVL